MSGDGRFGCRRWPARSSGPPPDPSSPSRWSRTTSTGCYGSFGASVARSLPQHEAAPVQGIVHPDHLALPREDPFTEGLMGWLRVVGAVGVFALELGEQQVLEPARAAAHVPAQTEPGESGDGLWPRPDLVEHLLLLLRGEVPRESEQHDVLDAFGHRRSPPQARGCAPRRTRSTPAAPSRSPRTGTGPPRTSSSSACSR